MSPWVKVETRTKVISAFEQNPRQISKSGICHLDGQARDCYKF